MAKEALPAPINIDRSAWFLIRRFGDDCAIVAWRRAEWCRCAGLQDSERQWRAVLHKLIDLHFRPRQGQLN